MIVAGGFATVDGQAHEGLVRFAPVPFGVSIAGPAEHTLRLLDDLTLAAEVAGSRTPVSYQWYHDGEAIAGANGPTLVLEHLVPKHEGQYRVLVSGAAGTAMSEPVTLTLVRGRPAR